MKPGDAHSRTQHKRASLALQKLGQRLVMLSEDDLSRISLPPDLAAAIQLARRITEHGAQRRQLRHIGKLMRHMDIQPIERGLATVTSQHRKEVDAFHSAEQWRDRLLREGLAGIAALKGEKPHLDSKKLKCLLQEALKEKTGNGPPRTARELFRYLRDELFTVHRITP